MLKDVREHVVGVLTLILLSLAVYGLVKLSANAKVSVNSEVALQNCCLNDQEKPHLLSATYYGVNNQLKAKLLLNNKGPQALEAYPTLFSMNGERFVPPPVIIEAESFRIVDMREWITAAGPQFTAGSIQIFHRGPDLILGAQIYLVDEELSLSFDEKLVETKTFKSSKLEGLWWMPSQRGEVYLALSNTSDAPLTVNARVDGHRPERAGTASIALGPHSTRLLNVLDDIMNHEQGAMSSYGSISLQHSAAPGALLARAMAQDISSGYSLSVQFSDPKTAKSSKLQGVGLRLGSMGGESLNPIVIARNVGDATTTVTGRLPYTTSDGSSGVVALPNLQLDAGEMALIDVARALRTDTHQMVEGIGGLEFEYSTLPGTVTITALSVSDNGNQLFRVPMWDIHAQRSSTGGYPWYIDGDSSTVVYIKNGEAHRQHYVVYLKYPGGSYTIGSTTIEVGQTVTYDLRKMRDEQIPDNDGHVIPPSAIGGQLHWSKVGGESGVLIGRSEQADTQLGISSNYACLNCCNDNPDPNDFKVLPSSASASVNDSVTFTASIYMNSCYGNSYYMNVDDAMWSSSNPDVATVGAGLALAQSAGTTNINAQWQTMRYLPSGVGGGGFGPPGPGPIGGSGECNEFPVTLNATAAQLTVKPKIDSISPAASAVGHPVTVTLSGKGFAEGASINVGAGVTVSEITVSSSTSMSATFSVAANASAGDRNVTVTVNGQTSNSKTFTVQVPDRLRVVSDTGNLPLQNCPSVVGRAITYQVVDSSSSHLAIAQAISVVEALDNLTNNTCGNGQPNPSPCEPTDDSGQFRDLISVNPSCGNTALSNCNSNPSCGYDYTQRWSTCFPEAIIELMSAPGITHCNQIKINNSTQLSVGTLMPK